MTTLADKLRSAKEIQFLLELEYDDGVIRAASYDIAVPYSGGTPKLFKSMMLAGLTVELSYDFINSVQPTPNVSITLANSDRLQDKEVTRALEAGYGTIYVWAPGCDWADIEDDGAIFKGRIVKQHHTKTHYVIRLVGLANDCMKTIPEVTINDNTWPSHRKSSSGTTGTAVSAQPVPLIFGDVREGVPLYCVDTSAYKYAIMHGVSKATDTEYSSQTLEVWDNTLTKIAPGGSHTFYPAVLDGEGNPTAIFDFAADRQAQEPMTCDAWGPEDKTGEFSGSAGTLITHPADIAHYLLVHHGTLDVADIDRGSFATARGLVPSLRYGSIINKQEDGQTIINRLFKHIYLCLSQRGKKLGCFALSDVAPTGFVFEDARDLVTERARFMRTPYDRISNNVHAFGRYHGQAGTYLEDVVIDRYKSRLARDSRNVYGEKPRTVLYCPDANTLQQTANVAKRFLSITAFQHDLIELQTPYWQVIDFRLGDIGKLTLTDGSSSDGSGWTQEPCVLVGQRFDAQSVKTTWWRIAT